MPVKHRRNPVILSLVSASALISFSGALADHYVAQNGQAPSGTFTTWATAASNIQDAVNVAYTNSTVWVGAGRYTLPANPVVYMGTNVVYIAKPLVLRSSNGVPETTIIDGQGASRGIVMSCSLGTTNYVVVDGFTVSNCAATNTGGGMYLVPGTWTCLVQNCVITDNSASNTAGGIGLPYTYSTTFRYVVSNCLIRGNYSPAGGGAYSDLRIVATGKFTHCIFENNTAVNAGGMYSSGAMEYESCIFRGNQVSQYGGGLMSVGGNFTARNCLFYMNVAGLTELFRRGGGVYVNTGSHALHNCTVVSNRIYNSGYGSGVQINGGSLLICNSIVYSNANNDNVYGAAFFTNSCTYPTNAYVLAGSGNITSPPAFVNFAAQDFHLSQSSPCINAGMNLPWQNGAKDLDNRNRIDRYFGTADMGCYEYLHQGMTFKVR